MILFAIIIGSITLGALLPIIASNNYCSYLQCSHLV
jgi:hypothetical protein